MGSVYPAHGNEVPESDRELLRGLIPGADGICGRHIGQAVVVTGPCGIKHVMSLSAGKALAVWLNQHCQPVRDAEFITLEGGIEP